MIKNIQAAKKEMVQRRAVVDMQPNVLMLDLKER
jgi:hypothetical protein